MAAAAPPPPCGAVDFPFEEGDEEAAAADVVGDQAPGVFRFPWQSCRGGLGVVAGGGGGGGGWEMRDVFFRSLVDGGAAAIGLPGDRLASPPLPSELRTRSSTTWARGSPSPLPTRWTLSGTLRC